MSNLLKNLNTKAEQLKGRQLAYVLISIFVVFALVGFATNYFIDTFLKSTENFPELHTSPNIQTADKVSYEGRITFVDPQNHPNENISYYLEDSEGKQVILLRAKDQKLEVAEGLAVTVTGTLEKTLDKKHDVLLVERIEVRR